jgi:hypothetical protein
MPRAYDPAGLVNHTHRRPLETNVQSCKHPHRCSPSFARGITSGKGRLPAGEQQPHVWDVLELIANNADTEQFDIYMNKLYDMRREGLTSTDGEQSIVEDIVQRKRSTHFLLESGNRRLPAI